MKLIDSVKQIRALHVDGQYTELRALKRQADSSMKPLGSFFLNGDYQPGIEWADRMVSQGAEVFIGVNPRTRNDGKTKDSIDTLVSLYADLDLEGEGIQEALAELLGLALPPNMIVKSGYGLHAYWRIQPTHDKELWKKVNTTIRCKLEHLKADKAVATDEARILRLVPYPNLKHGSINTEILWFTEGIYTVDQVAAAFRVTDEATPDKKLAFGTTLQTGNLGDKLLRMYVARAEPGNRHNAGVDLACQLRDNGISYEEAEDIMQRFVDNTDYPGGGYNISEALTTLQSIYQTAPREPWNIRVPAVKVEITPEVQEFILNANRTDAGNAEIFEALYGQDVRYNHTRKNWVVWQGTRWEPDTRGAINNRTVETARAIQRAAMEVQNVKERAAIAEWGFRTENLKPMNAMLTMAESRQSLAMTEEQFDTDPLLVGVDNGTLDLRTGELQEPKRDDYITKSLGTHYDPSADCPRWKQFMEEVFDGNQEIISFIQRALGYTLTGDTREQVLFLMHGGGRNGKSRFLETVMKLLNDYGHNTSFETFDAAGRSSNAEYTLASLKGARFVSIVETEEDKRLNEAKVKSVTGQDTITARHIYGSPFNYKPSFKVWLAMNHKPHIRGMDEGIWRRILLIPFTQNFAGREDKQLDKKLEAELPGILNWILEGLRVWHEQGLNPPAAIIEAVKEYRSVSDIVAQWIEECCVIGEGSMVSSEAYNQFRAWLKARGEREFSQTLWGSRMSDRGLESKRKTHNKVKVSVYEGIRLSDDLPAFGKEWK